MAYSGELFAPLPCCRVAGQGLQRGAFGPFSQHRRGPGAEAAPETAGCGAGATMAVNVASWFHLLWACVFALVGLATAAYAFGVYRIRKSLRRKATHVVTVSLLTVFATIRSVAFFIRAFDFDYLPHPRAAQSPWINLVVFVVPAVALHALYTVRLGPAPALATRRARSWPPHRAPSSLRALAALLLHFSYRSPCQMAGWAASRV